METIKTLIPFSGFYHSLHDSEIQRAFDDMFEDDCQEVLSQKLYDDTHIAMNYRQAFEYYAREYCEAFAHKFEIEIEFNSLSSPREYNFTTDLIVASITLDEANRIFKATNKEALDEALANAFTSYDGFHSFYPNSLEETGDNLEEWVECQVGVLISTYIKQITESDFDIMEEHEVVEYPHELAHNAIDHALGLEENKGALRLTNIAYYLRKRNERKAA